MRVSPLKKLRGCIAAPPNVPFEFPEEAYLFFFFAFAFGFAFFFAAILFSSKPSQILSPAMLAERVFIHHV